MPRAPRTAVAHFLTNFLTSRLQARWKMPGSVAMVADATLWVLSDRSSVVEAMFVVMLSPSFSSSDDLLRFELNTLESLQGLYETVWAYLLSMVLHDQLMRHQLMFTGTYVVAIILVWHLKYFDFSCWSGVEILVKCRCRSLIRLL